MMDPAKLQEILGEHKEWLRGNGGTRAVLTGAVLTGAVLTGAVLTGADLTRADLRGAVLTRADLRGAVLTGAVLTDALLTGADLRGGKFIAQAAVRFTRHGECGRELMAIKTDNKNSPVTLWCGCFTGTPNELRDYIKNSDEKHAKSRTLALDTVLMLLEV